MKTLTVEITNDDALKVLHDLQEKRFINIIARPDLNSAVFPGESLLLPKNLKSYIKQRKRFKYEFKWSQN